MRSPINPTNPTINAAASDTSNMIAVRDGKNVGPRTYAIRPNPVVPANAVVIVAKSFKPICLFCVMSRASSRSLLFSVLSSYSFSP